MDNQYLMKYQAAIDFLSMLATSEVYNPFLSLYQLARVYGADTNKKVFKDFDTEMKKFTERLKERVN